MNLIIFGPPGSGKGTYSSKLQKPLGVIKISTGDIFRDAIKQGNELGKKVAGYLASGQLVPDEIVIEVLKERLEKEDAKNGVILDGYPRTVEQAKNLEKLLKIDAIINIIAPEELLVEKISARRICKNPKCDEIYNIANIKRTINGIKYVLPPVLPKKTGICDKCGNELYQRDDDKPEIIKQRLEIYKKQSEPVLDYYKKNKKKFVNVHMCRPPDEIIEMILAELKKAKLI